MTEPDYRIEECFEPENMRVYFSVYTLGANPQLIRRQFETLEEAKFKSYKEYWNEYHTQLVKSNFLSGFEDGAKWKQERICDSEVIQRIRASKSDAEASRIIRAI